MDLQDAFDAGFDAVKEYVDNSFAAFEKRIIALEGRAQPDVAGMIAEALAKSEGQILQQTNAMIDKRVELEVATIPIPKDGKDVDPAQVSSMVDDAAKRILAGWDRPQDGKSVTVDDVRPLIEESVAKGVAAIPTPKDGKDGIGLAGALIDRKGVLVTTLSDGTQKELGPVLPTAESIRELCQAAVVEILPDAVAKAVAALPTPKDGEDGASITIDDVRPMIEEAVTKAVTLIPVPKDGTSVTVEDMAPLIEEAATKHVQSLGKSLAEAARSMVAAIEIPKAPELPDIPALVDAAVKALPPAKNGKDADPVEVAEQIAAEVSRAVADLPVPKDGISVTLDDVRPLIEESVQKAAAAISIPKDGRDGATVEELRPIIEDAVAKSVASIPIPKDGVDGADVVDLLIDREGALVATLSNGKTKTLGPVVGKDGVDADMEALEQSIADKVAAIPVPKDGTDGIGFDDLTEEMEDEGRVIVRRFFHAGQMVKESRMQTMTAIFRGVHDQARTYLPGDMVSRGGSLWHCDAECKGPFNGDSWTLSVKKGRDGKGD